MVTEETFERSDEAPTDEAGHPIHPERGHRICGAKKSDRTTPTEHGRERDDYEYCLLPAAWGVEDVDVGPCRNHPFSGKQVGESNPSFKHGAYSEFHDWMLETIPDEHRKALDALDLEEHGENFVETHIKRLTYLARITGDERYSRELRQWLKEFGPIEVNAEKHQLEHSGEIDGRRTHELDDATRDVVREVLRRRRGEDDE